MRIIIFRNNRLLAAEYVIGTLRGLARKRYERYLQQYPQLSAMTELWQNDLNLLTATLPETKPKPELWHTIKTKL